MMVAQQMPAAAARLPAGLRSWTWTLTAQPSARAQQLAQTVCMVHGHSRARQPAVGRSCSRARGCGLALSHPRQIIHIGGCQIWLQRAAPRLRRRALAPAAALGAPCSCRAAGCSGCWALVWATSLPGLELVRQRSTFAMRCWILLSMWRQCAWLLCRQAAGGGCGSGRSSASGACRETEPGRAGAALSGGMCYKIAY